MQRSLRAPLLKKVHISTERLQRAIDMHSYLLTSIYDRPPDNSVKQLQKLSHTSSNEFSNQMSECDIKLPDEQNSKPPSQPLGSSPPAHTESYHETMRKHSRRLYSWPSREVDAFEEEGGYSVDFVPKMRALESTAQLSLATFTSLLIEFVARLDHLVEAVDDLSKLAKFKIRAQ